MSSKPRIAISGKSGCGNSTVTRLVAEELGLRIINYTLKDMAAEKGISFDEMVELANSHPPRYDLELDRKLVEMAAAPGCVLGSRLAIWLLEDADLKVYLEAPPEVRARRIAQREGVRFEKAYRAMVRRDELDRERYRKIYRIDVDRYDFADLVLDAAAMDQHEITRAVLRELASRR